MSQFKISQPDIETFALATSRAESTVPNKATEAIPNSVARLAIEDVALKNPAVKITTREARITPTGAPTKCSRTSGSCERWLATRTIHEVPRPAVLARSVEISGTGSDIAAERIPKIVTGATTGSTNRFANTA